jgi:hypothetical protein
MVFTIYDCRWLSHKFSIFSFYPRSPREIACPSGGKADISWGKSAKSAVKENDYLIFFVVLGVLLRLCSEHTFVVNKKFPNDSSKNVKTGDCRSRSTLRGKLLRNDRHLPVMSS